MNFVPHFNFYGIDAKQIPCITAEGAPTTTTEGAVGCFYMDTLTGTLYKCVSVVDGVCVWNIAESINIITPEMYGAVGDGIADDREAIQSALDNANNRTVIFSKNYLVSAPSEELEIPVMELRDNNTIYFANGSTITLKPTANGGARMMVARGVKGVHMYGNVHLIGDRDEHLGTDGEFSNGLWINGCENIYVEKITVEKTWGDGVGIVRRQPTSYDGEYYYNKNIHFGEIIVEKCSRNGLTVAQADGLTIGSLRCVGLDRAEPKACIDFEVDSLATTLKNVHIGYIYSEDCSGGFVVCGNSFVNNGEALDVSVNIDNLVLKNSGFSLRGFRSGYRGIFRIANIVATEQPKEFYISTSANTECVSIIEHANIMFRDDVDTTVAVYLDEENTGGFGNLHINNLELPNLTLMYSLRINAYALGLKNTKINMKTDKPIFSPSGVYGIDWSQSKIVVDMEEFFTKYNVGLTYFTNNFWATEYHNLSANGRDLIMFPSKSPFGGHPVSFVCRSANKIGFYLALSSEDVDGFIVPTSAGFSRANRQIFSTEIGASITFVYDHDIGKFRLVEKQGEWTITTR